MSYLAVSRDIDIQEPREGLTLVHVPLTHPPLWMGPGVRNLDHVQVLYGAAPHQVRVRSVKRLKQLRSERVTHRKAGEVVRTIEKQVDGHPKRAESPPSCR